MIKLTAQQILKEARDARKGASLQGYVDDKVLVEPDEIITLLEAGAKINKSNSRVEAGQEFYYHSVFYRGHQFIAVTYNPLDFSKYKKC